MTNESLKDRVELLERTGILLSFGVAFMALTIIGMLYLICHLVI